ncbi:hypothetical protein M3B43_00980 [Nesterenkonia massiliensis]|uniref:YcaO domain-containing protein n=1 Tax=Nesterenkonia massiliensis TaxID=1232429 RepID=A0ABT2HMK6_9MICC|nr:hypothetical protein [Nesterenkonia massiliensis]MCT1605913.1 hypothetical protein [Nesterenkonia massiliensis]
MSPQFDNPAEESFSSTSGHSPIRQFIAKTVEPQRKKLNTWDNPLATKSILLQDARKRRRTTPKNIGNSHLLMYKERLIGGATWVNGGVTTLVSQQAQHATQSLQLMRQYLKASDVAVLPGRTYHIDRYPAAHADMKSMQTAVTLRPTSARVHGGTTVNITNPKHFEGAWRKAAKACQGLRPLDQQVELEEYHPGVTLRLYVVGEEAVAAVVRVPLYVVGNGSSTIGALVDHEIQRRSACDYLAKAQPTVDDEFLQSVALTRETVPKAGEIVLLSHSGDRRAGGISVDVLDKLDPQLHALAVDAMWAFPGLAASAVDILTPALDGAQQALVVDVDPHADIAEFLYPAYGEYRRVGLSILDHMIHSPNRRR